MTHTGKGKNSKRPNVVIVKRKKPSKPAPPVPVRDSEVRYIGDLRTPPFGGELKPVGHGDWMGIHKPTTQPMLWEEGRCVVCRSRIGEVVMGRLKDDSNGDSTKCEVVETFDVACTQRTGRVLRTSRRDIWFFNTPEMKVPVPVELSMHYSATAPAPVVVKKGKVKVIRSPGHVTYPAWKEHREFDRAKVTDKQREAARSLARDGDYWWFTYAGKKGTGRLVLGNVPGKDERAALRNARAVFAGQGDDMTVKQILTVGQWDAKAKVCLPPM